MKTHNLAVLSQADCPENEQVILKVDSRIHESELTTDAMYRSDADKVFHFLCYLPHKTLEKIKDTLKMIV